MFLILVFIFLFLPEQKNFNFSSSIVIKKLPEVKAKSFGVFLFPELKLLFGSNLNQPQVLASVTKLITAYLACRAKIFDQSVTVNFSDLHFYGFIGGFKIGEKFLVKDLIRMFLKNSSNDAAEIVFRVLPDKEKLINQLNEKLQTNFKIIDGSGLNDKNQASVTDLALFVRQSFQECPEIFSWSAEKSQLIQGKYVYNLNGYEKNFLGGKIGALPNYGYNFVGLFDDGQQKYLIIVLGADSFFSEVDKILNFLNPQVFNNFNLYCASNFEVTDKTLRACRTNPLLNLNDYVEINLGNVRGRVIKNGKVVKEYFFIPSSKIKNMNFDSGLFRVIKKDNFLILKNDQILTLGLKNFGPVDIYFESEPQKFLDFLNLVTTSTLFLLFF